MPKPSNPAVPAISSISAEQLRTLLASLGVTPETLAQVVGAKGKAAPDRTFVQSQSPAEADDDFLSRRLLELAKQRPGITVNEVVKDIRKHRDVPKNYRQSVTTKANALAKKGLLITAYRLVGRRGNRCLYLPEHVRFQGDIDGHHPRAEVAARDD